MHTHHVRPQVEALKPLVQRLYSSLPRWQPLPVTRNTGVDSFRKDAFKPWKPVQFESGTFSKSLPAVPKWFSPHGSSIAGSLPNYDYLTPFASTVLPLELTSDNGKTFTRAEAPLAIFLEWCRMTLDSPTTAAAETPRLYLAQAPISRLPHALREDLPAPDLVLQAGAGDIYDANLWMGVPPTYTPLHRDPNPNLFVQLAGRKIVRMMEPAVGDEVFARVQKKLGKCGPKAFRGDEMMTGEERRLLEREVWDEVLDEGEERIIGYEGSLEAGSGAFIPQGWWHSIKGVGEGISASANWWFR